MYKTSKQLIACITLLSISINIQASNDKKIHSELPVYHAYPDNLDPSKMIVVKHQLISLQVPMSLNISIINKLDKTILYTCSTMVEDTEKIRVEFIYRLKNNKFILRISDYRRKTKNDEPPGDRIWHDLVPTFTLRFLDCPIVKTLTTGHQEQVANITKLPSNLNLVVYEDGFDMIFPDPRKTNEIFWEKYDDNGNKIDEHPLLLNRTMFNGVLRSGKIRSHGFVLYGGYRFYANGSSILLEKLEKYNSTLNGYQSDIGNKFNDGWFYSKCIRFKLGSDTIHCLQYDFLNDLDVIEARINVPARPWMLGSLLNLKNGGMLLAMCVRDKAKAYVMRPNRPTVVDDIKNLSSCSVDYFDEDIGEGVYPNIYEEGITFQETHFTLSNYKAQL